MKRGETVPEEAKVLNRYEEYYEGLLVNEVENAAQAPVPHERENEVSLDEDNEITLNELRSHKRGWKYERKKIFGC